MPPPSKRVGGVEQTGPADFLITLGAKVRQNQFSPFRVKEHGSAVSSGMDATPGLTSDDSFLAAAKPRVSSACRILAPEKRANAYAANLRKNP